MLVYFEPAKHFAKLTAGESAKLVYFEPGRHFASERSKYAKHTKYVHTEYAKLM